MRRSRSRNGLDLANPWTIDSSTSKSGHTTQKTSLRWDVFLAPSIPHHRDCSGKRRLGRLFRQRLFLAPEHVHLKDVFELYVRIWRYCCRIVHGLAKSRPLRERLDAFDRNSRLELIMAFSNRMYLCSFLKTPRLKVQNAKGEILSANDLELLLLRIERTSTASPPLLLLPEIPARRSCAHRIKAITLTCSQALSAPA